MRLFAATKAAIGQWREKTFNLKKTGKVISTVLAGLFITNFCLCLNYLLLDKNSLSIVSQKFEQTNVKLSVFQVPRSLAQESFIKELAENKFEKNICHQIPSSVSVSDPQLLMYKLENLCLQPSANENLIQTEKSDQTNPENSEQKFKEEIAQILQATPMKPMIDPISEQEKTVAAFLVGIALKESGLGAHAPRKNGHDCYNYWGFKGNTNPTPDGYSCFSSPREAVEKVAARIDKLVEKNINTPQKMVIWKCGSSCAGHSPSGVSKWIQDVSIYFNKIKNS